MKAETRRKGETDVFSTSKCGRHGRHGTGLDEDLSSEDEGRPSTYRGSITT